MKAQINGLKYNTRFILESRKDKKTGIRITENIPVIMSVTFNGLRVFFNIGFKTNTRIWDNKSDYSFQIKNTFNNDRISASVINASIREHEMAVDKVFMKLDEYPTKSTFKSLLKKALNKPEKNQEKEKDAFFYFDLYIEMKKPSISSWRTKQLTTCMNHFKKFATDKHKKLNLDTVNISTIGDFENHLKNEPGNPRSQNTVSGLLIRLRSLFNFAYQQGWTKNQPFEKYKIEKEVYGDPIFLSKDELDKLFNKDIKNERLARVRDIFCLQCFTGARIGDFSKLKHHNIIEGTIQYVPSKTANEKATVCKIPISNRAKTIIDKYDLPNGDLVPYISGQKYNVYIKELFEECKLNRKVARLNPVTRQTEIVLLHDIASSHLARRTFIGILFKNTKNEIIASMSGHVQGSKAFHRYYGITTEDRINAISALD